MLFFGTLNYMTTMGSKDYNKAKAKAEHRYLTRLGHFHRGLGHPTARDPKAPDDDVRALMKKLEEQVKSATNEPGEN